MLSTHGCVCIWTMVVHVCTSFPCVQKVVPGARCFTCPSPSKTWPSLPCPSCALLQGKTVGEQIVKNKHAQGVRWRSRAGRLRPQMWVQDAASAIVTALPGQMSSGISDVMDDKPLTRGELMAVMAQAVGRTHLLHPPAPVMRLLTGIVPAVLNARVGWASLVQERSVALKQGA